MDRSATGPIDAVILDFDGTILDTEWSEYVTVRDEFRLHGLHYTLEEFRERVGRVDGRHWSEILQDRVGQRPDIDDIVARRRRAHHDMIAATEIRPGVLSLLDRAERTGKALAVASSSSSSWVGRHLGERGLLHRFAVVTTRDQVARAKPWPDVFLEAARRLRVDPARCLTVEDSHHGVAAAKAAGMYCVAVPNPVTAGSDLSAADLVLGSLAELPWADLGLG
jgi:HAD superfamily hydrolase (TIGR01509 family)